jgi:hypothetical protein
MSIRKTLAIAALTSVVLLANACGKGPSDPMPTMPGDMDMRVTSPDSSGAQR